MLLLQLSNLQVNCLLYLILFHVTCIWEHFWYLSSPHINCIPKLGPPPKKRAPSDLAIAHICWPAPLSSLVLLLMTIRILNTRIVSKTKLPHIFFFPTSALLKPAEYHMTWNLTHRTLGRAHNWRRAGPNLCRVETFATILPLLPSSHYFAHQLAHNLAHTILANNLSLKFAHNTQYLRDIASPFVRLPCWAKYNLLCQHA